MREEQDSDRSLWCGPTPIVLQSRNQHQVQNNKKLKGRPPPPASARHTLQRRAVDGWGRAGRGTPGTGGWP
jgi:hypothetical protein